MRIDYSPLRPPDVLGAVLDPVAASVSRFADAAVAKKRQERELAMRREQEARLAQRDQQRYDQALSRQGSLDRQNQERLDFMAGKFAGQREDKALDRTAVADRQKVGIEAGERKQSSDQGFRTGMQDDQQEFLGGQGDLNRTAAMERERVKAESPRYGRNSAERLDFNRQQEKSKNLRKDVGTAVTRWNAKTTQEAAFQFPNIIKMLDSGNGKLQNQALITMMRIAQGDNRFSDADAKLAMNSGAGWLDQVESWASKGATGTLGADVIGTARQAAGALNGFYGDKARRMNEDFESFVSNPNYYDPNEAEQILRREFPGFGQHLDAKRGAGQPGAAPGPSGDRIRPSVGPLPGAADAAGAVLQDDEEMDPDINSEAPLDAAPARPAAPQRPLPPQLIPGLPPGFLGNGRKQPDEDRRARIQRLLLEAR